MKLVCVLLLYVATAHSVFITAPLTRVESIESQLIREGKLDALKTLRNSRASRLSSGQQPLLNVMNNYYIVNVTLGTPPQTIPVQFDTLTSDLLVIDYSKNLNSKKVMFHTSKSSTFTVKDNSSHYESNPFYGSLYYYIGNDVLGLAGVKVKKQDIQMGYYLSGQFNKEPENGVLGLGLKTDPKSNTTSPIYNLINQWDNQLYTVWFNKLANNTQTGAGGVVTYGAIDTTNCDTKWGYAPLVNPDKNSWQWNINSYSIGISKFSTKYKVIVGASSKWIEVPDAVLRNILFNTGSKFDSDYNMYVLPCSSRESLPDIILTANGGPQKSFTLGIPASNYILDIGSQDGLCGLDFHTTNGFEYDTSVWILGDPFIQNYCSLFDYGKKRMGFATPLSLL